jgi:hypothetical protein
MSPTIQLAACFGATPVACAEHGRAAGSSVCACLEAYAASSDSGWMDGWMDGLHLLMPKLPNRWSHCTQSFMFVDAKPLLACGRVHICAPAVRRQAWRGMQYLHTSTASNMAAVDGSSASCSTSAKGKPKSW